MEETTTKPMTDEEIEDFDFELAAAAEVAGERHLESSRNYERELLDWM